MMYAEVIPTTTDIRFDVPLYTVPEAARALGVPATTFSAWARGYVRHGRGRREVQGDPVVTTLPDHGGPIVPFIGLAEGMVLAAVRRAGVPLQRIRPALAVLADEIGVEHALGSRRLYTEGAEVLFDYAERMPPEDRTAARDLVVIRSGQRVFSDVVASYLRRIDYGQDAEFGVPVSEIEDVLRATSRRAA